MTGQIESRKEIEKQSKGSARYWQLEFEAADNTEKEYRTAFADLEKRYRGEGDIAFNIFFSNVETLKPIIYSQTPKPDVRPKIKTVKDPLSRQTSIMLETSLDYNCNEYDFDDVVSSVRDDRLIGGRGVGWVTYEPLMQEVEEEIQSIDPIAGEIVTSTEKREEIIEQDLRAIYIHRDKYKQSPASKWEDVRWVARCHTPTRDEAVEQFGEVAKRIPLNYDILDSSTREKNKDYARTDVFKRAKIWEIWDKQKLERVWYCEGFDELLEVEDDPYGLDQFFPMPKPYLGITTNSTMVPVPDYTIYKKQSEVVENTTRRINLLTKQLQAKGLYSQVDEKIKDLIEHQGDNFLPTLNITDTKLADQIVFWPIEKIAEVVIALYQAREQAIQSIYQITGLSDIVRGASDPNETATAQQIKGNFANNRLTNIQKPMQMWVRDLLRIKAEIMAEHFTPETLAAMTNMPLESQIDPQTGQPTAIGVLDMVALLRDEKLRKYRIDIETDSTVEADADADKQRRIEFMTAVTEMINQLAPLVAGGIMQPEVAKQLLSFGARGFKIGRELEDALDTIGDPSEQQQQQQQPSEAEIKAQAEQQKLQVTAQTKQAELQLKAQGMQQQAQMDQASMQQEIEAERIKLQFDQELEMIKQQNAFALERQKLEDQKELALYKAELDAQVKQNVGMSRSVSNANA